MPARKRRSEKRTITERRWAWLDESRNAIAYIHPLGKSKRKCWGLFASDDERLVRITLTYEVPR